MTHGRSSGRSSSLVGAPGERRPDEPSGRRGGPSAARARPVGRRPGRRPRWRRWVGWSRWTIRKRTGCSDPSVARHPAASPAGTRRRPSPAPSGASCAPWSAAGRRRRCRGCGRSRAAGSGRAGRRRRRSPARRPGPCPVDAGEVGPGALDERAREATGSPPRPRRAARSLPSGSVSTGLQTTPTVRSPSSSGQSKTKTARSTPIWQAASPTPSAAYIVATMSATSGAQLVVVRRHLRLRAVHHRRAPAGHRAHGAALGERAVRRVRDVGRHGRGAYGRQAAAAGKHPACERRHVCSAGEQV